MAVLLTSPTHKCWAHRLGAKARRLKVPVRMHQARKPVLDKGARMRPDPWPSPDFVTTNLAACLGPASLLDGEQNIHVPCVGSMQYTVQPAPHIFSSFLTLTPTPRSVTT